MRSKEIADRFVIGHAGARWAIAVSFVYLICLGGTFAGSLSWVHQGILAAGLFLWCLSFGILLYRETDCDLALPTLWVSIPVGLILAEKAARAALAPTWQSSEDLIQSASLLLLFLVITTARHNRSVVIWAIAGASAVATVVGIYGSYHYNFRELALPLGNRALMAGLFSAALPVSLGLCYRYRKSTQLWWAVTILMLLIVGVLKTRSAAAIAVMFLAVAVFTLIMVRRPFLIALVGIVAAACLLMLPQVSEFEPIDRLSAVASGRGDPTLSWANRVRYWEGAVDLFAQRPVFGHGPGQVGLNYGPARIQAAGFSPHGEVVADVHSVLFNWLLEYGSFGAATRVCLYAALVVGSFTRVRGVADVTRLAAAAGLTTYGVYSLAHYQLSNPAIVLLLVCLSAVAVKTGHRFELSRAKHKIVAACILCTESAILAAQCRAAYANYVYRTGVDRPGNAGVGRLVRATALDPRGGVYNLAAAIRIERLLLDTPDDSEDSRFLQQAAERHYKEAVRIQEFMLATLGAYGGFLRRTGRVCESVPILKKAASLDFFHSYAHFDLATAVKECGPYDAAVDQAAIAMLTLPSGAFATKCRAEPEFLDDSLERALGWLRSWTLGSEDERLPALTAFLQARRRNIETADVVTLQLTFSDLLATELRDDPFAFVFQRRMIPFAASEIAVDGLESGTWAPEGIGTFSFLNRTSYREVMSAYETNDLGGFVVQLGR